MDRAMSMPASSRMLHLLNTRKADYSLAQPFYNDADFYALDMRHVFGRNWLFAGLSCEIPTPGRYFTISFGSESVVIVRDAQRGIRAFHNTCRHRGSRLCLKEKGSGAKLVCPYHQWTYNLDGSLAFAGHMGNDFDKAGFSLKPVHVDVVAGYIFVSLAENPPAFDDYRRDITPYLEPHDIDNCKVAFESTLIEKANWKLVIENNRECYHCKGSHPELLNTLSEYDNTDDPRLDPKYRDLLLKKAADWDAQGIAHAATPPNLQHRAVRLPFIRGAHSMTLDGSLASKKLLGQITDPDLGSCRMLSLPNSWNHLLSDHVIAFRVLPLGPQETAVTTKWLVHKDAVEGVDYDIERLTRVWAATNDQDRKLAEDNQLGINSKAYEPGPYSADIEFGVRNFIDWYCGEMSEELSRDLSFSVAAQ
jgi:Rieske 2Fe-2S family protein